MLKAILAIAIFGWQVGMVAQPPVLRLANNSFQAQRVWVQTNCNRVHGMPYGPMRGENFPIDAHDILNFTPQNTCLENPNAYINFWVGLDNPGHICAWHVQQDKIKLFEDESGQCGPQSKRGRALPANLIMVYTP